MNNGDMPASPAIYQDQHNFGHTVHPSYTNFGGLTKREAFAMAAMQGLCANGTPGYYNFPSELAPLAVRHADHLLAELEMHP